MMGTLATVLARTKIPTFGDRFRADVEGDVEDVEGVLRITCIRVKYTLKVPPGRTADAREALKVYQTECPAAMSVKGAIGISDTAEVTELTESS
jgi:organic hydroperoxide reductase OsmC/OhrA